MPKKLLKKLSPFTRKKSSAKGCSDSPGLKPRPHGWNQLCREKVWPRGTWKLATYPELLKTVSVPTLKTPEIEGDIIVWQTLQDCADLEQGPSMGGSRHLFDISEDWYPSRASLRVVLRDANDDIAQYIFAELQRMRHLLP